MTRVSTIPRWLALLLAVTLLVPPAFGYLARPQTARAAEIGEGQVNLVTSNNASYGSQVIAWGQISYAFRCPEHPTNGSTADVPPIFASDVWLVPSDKIPVNPQTTAPIELGGTGGKHTGTIVTHFTLTFEDQVIALINPDMDGPYDIVLDHCQDSRFDYGQDYLLTRALGVYQAQTPGPDAPEIQMLNEMKQRFKWRAEAAIDKMIIMGVVIAGWDAFVGLMSIIGPPLGVAMWAFTGLLHLYGYLTVRSLWQEARAYTALYNDPPDPEFQQLTFSEPLARPDGTLADPLAASAEGFMVGMQHEDAVAEMLLHSFERYQGAVLDQRPDWQLIHARAMRDEIEVLIGEIQRSNAEAQALSAQFASDPRAGDAIWEQLGDLQADIAANGLDPAARQELRNLGLSDDEIDARLQQFSDIGLPESAADVQALFSDYQASGQAVIDGLTAWLPAIDATIAALENDPTVGDAAPIAQAGGPYGGSAGTPIAFDASATTSPVAVVSYEWDMDADGAFDDATGATPSYTFDAPTTSLVGVRVTNDFGRQSVAYAPVSVAAGNQPPHFDSISALPEGLLIEVGETFPFSVGVSDPEGDAVALSWQLDGMPVGDGGASLAFTPDETDIGFHALEVVASNPGSTAGARYTWLFGVGRADQDGDGWRGGADCDDSDPAVNPGASEVLGNGKDDDCDPATPDSGDTPVAGFRASGSGRNVALAEGGATVLSVTTPANGGVTYGTRMINFSSSDDGWATSGTANQAAVIELAGGRSWLIDRVAVMPRVGTGAVKDFAIDVSTDNVSWTTALTGTVSTTSNALQEFALAQPVEARYVRYRPLTNRGATSTIGTSQLKVFTSEESASPLTFTSTTSDPDDNIVAWHWDFGDGTTSSELQPTHHYAAGGSYTVSLTVTDAAGNTSTATREQRVLSGPLVSVTASPATQGEQQIVGFTSTASDPDGGTILFYRWTWNDGTPDVYGTASSRPNHVFSDNGSYTVSLTVTDSQEQTTTVQQMVTITNRPPTANAGPDETVVWGKPWATDRIAISDPSTSDQTSLTCDWDFGDGQTQQVTSCTKTSGSLAHAWAMPGSYTARLTVTDKDGASASDSRVVTVVRRTSFVQFTDVQPLVGGSLRLTAKLHDRVDWLPIAGESLTFSAGAASASATTGADGMATVTLTAPAGVAAVAVGFGGSALFEASSIQRPIRAPKGDIIFAIDESASMGGAIDAVKENVNGIAVQLGADLDFALGLVGYGAGTGTHVGGTAGTPHIHTPLGVDVSPFGQQVATLQTDGGIEPAFAAITTALSDPMGLRDGAGACVVLITDEGGSENAGPSFPQTRADAIAALQAQGAVFLGVINPATVYRNDFLPVADATGGQLFDIYDFTDDPEPVLEAIVATCVSQILTPDLVVGKTDGQTSVTPGSTVEYTLTIENAGSEQATGITLTDTLPAGTSFVAASDGGAASGGIVSWPAFELAPGASVTRTVRIQLTGTFADGDELTNTASALDDGTHGADPTPGDNIASDTDTVSAPVNGAPVASDQQVVGSEDTPLAITLTASDAEGNALSWQVVGQPSHGTISGSAPDLGYLPDANWHGTDTLTFRVSDGEHESNLATVTITVGAVNDAPVAAADAYTTDAGSELVVPAAGLLANDSDVDGDALVASVVDQPLHGTLALEPEGGFRYLPNPGFAGSDTFSYRAGDGTAHSEAATVTIEVVASGSPPVADAGADQTVGEGAVVTLDGSGSSDPEGDTLSFHWELVDASAGAPPLILSAAGTPAVSFATSDDASYTLRLTVTDAGGASASDEVVITVTNVAPSLAVALDRTTLHQGESLAGTGAFSDPGADAWTATLDPGDGSGAVPLALDGVELTLAHRYLMRGAFTVTVCVSDDDGGSDCVEAGVVTIRAYAIFAGSAVCDARDARALQWTGSDGLAIGDVHSNGGLKIAGSGHRAEGQTTYRCDLQRGGNAVFTDGPTNTDEQRPWPVAFTAADFSCDYTMAGRFDLMKNGPWWVGGTKASRQLRPGTYCATGGNAQITLSGSGISGEVTLVASAVQLSGSDLRLTAHEHGVLVLATGSAPTALAISGSRAHLTGLLVAPNGGLALSGADLQLAGSAIGLTVKLTGSRWRIEAD